MTFSKKKPENDDQNPPANNDDDQEPFANDDDQDPNVDVI